MSRMNISVSQEKLKIYQAVVASHSLENEAFEDEWKKWGNTVQKIDLGRDMLEILKDADALDRFRLTIIASGLSEQSYFPSNGAGSV